ncbi:hypothetical protein DK389_20095 [Methylobacterium durans]|uniref:Uncharacterized protein n=1 Tax=Methylobacterium durans TaxID=2202825 RepID=A0A2U8WAN3_9HYPH|nr:hypothetical protein DK389_20095 [Methylobacterium durans]
MLAAPAHVERAQARQKDMGLRQGRVERVPFLTHRDDQAPGPLDLGPRLLVQHGRRPARLAIRGENLRERHLQQEPARRVRDLEGGVHQVGPARPGMRQIGCDRRDALTHVEVGVLQVVEGDTFRIPLQAVERAQMEVVARHVAASADPDRQRRGRRWIGLRSLRFEGPSLRRRCRRHHSHR